MDFQRLHTQRARSQAPAAPSAGVNCNSYVPAKGVPGNLKGTQTPYTCPTYSTAYAAAYHTYKLVWTPGWIAWMIDTQVYRNSTNAPWRPVTMVRAIDATRSAPKRRRRSRVRAAPAPLVRSAR